MAKTFTPQTPDNYIKKGNARKLPIYECWINEDFQSTGIANVLVSRIHKNGNLTGAVYLIDLFCLGVKDSVCFFNIHKDEYEETTLSLIPDKIKIAYNTAHNLIYGAEIYAEELGLSAHKSFRVAQFILEEDTDEIELEYFEFGLNGKPHLFLYEDEDRTREIKILERNLGKEGFSVTYPDSESFNDDAFAEHEDEINDNDSLFYLYREDIPVFATLINITETYPEEKIASEVEKYIDSFENIPDFILHKTTDDLYNNWDNGYQATVKAVKYSLPDPTHFLVDENYPEGILEIEQDTEDEMFETSDDEVEYQDKIQSALEIIKEKHKGKEALAAFLTTHYLLEDDEDSERLALENYIRDFPDSLNARALFLSDYFYFHEENNTYTSKELLLKLPFKITESYCYTSERPHLHEILCYLFLQGMLHLRSGNPAGAEAALREMARLRCKKHPYFEIIRTLLTQEKIEKIEPSRQPESHLKIIK